MNKEGTRVPGLVTTLVERARPSSLTRRTSKGESRFELSKSVTTSNATSSSIDWLILGIPTNTIGCESLDAASMIGCTGWLMLELGDDEAADGLSIVHLPNSRRQC